MTWSELIDWGASELERAGVEDPYLNADYLALHALGLWRRQELRDRLESVASQEDEFRKLIQRRATREPLQYIIGEWEFFGLRLYTSPEALIPRPETEVLVEEALKEAETLEAPRVLDIGTGSGAIALALASRLAKAEVIGIDVSDDALALADRNRERLGLRNVTFLKRDILSDDLQDHAGRIDILVSNPPYVSAGDYSTIEPELEHEPRIAITDEAHGLTFYERIIDIASHLLTPPGVLLFELGYDVADAVRCLAIAHEFTVLRIARDLQGVERVLVAKRNV